MIKAFILTMGIFLGVVANGETLSFTTFNTALANGYVDDYQTRKAPIIDALAKHDTDVLCLQEVWNNKDVELIKASLRHKFPYSYSFYKFRLKFWWGSNGLLLLSRYPLTDSRVQEFDSFFLQRSALIANVHSPLGPLSVTCTHLSTYFGSFPPYLGRYGSWEGEALDQSAKLSQPGAMNSSNVILGDLNSAPALEDLSEYSVGVYQTFLDHGYTSPFVDLAPSCTWCSDNKLTGEGTESYILDHIMIHESLQDFDVSASRVLTETIGGSGKGRPLYLSDHFGVRVTLKKR